MDSGYVDVAYGLWFVDETISWTLDYGLWLWLDLWFVDETTSWICEFGLWSGYWAIIWTMDCVCGLWSVAVTLDCGLWSVAESVTWILETVDIMVESLVIGLANSMTMWLANV